MWALYSKELNSFFSNLTGIVVVVIFLLLNSLFLWVFPGSTNLFDNQSASLWPLFNLAPWVFLFLIPAITMRSFAEEKKAGTLELLLTRPVSNIQVIFAKFLSALSLAIIALIPTLIFYLSINLLGDPKGNIDHGAVWGSYIGLIFLAACYTSIGIFTSTVTDNSIIAFLLSVFLCFVVFSGFDYISRLIWAGTTGNAIINLGIEAHYQSISRGVIDSRDVVYFLSAISVFLVFANLKLDSKRW